MKEFIDRYFEPIRDMFFRMGIKSVTMDNICSELGISKRTLYQKFSNKDQLVNEIFHKDFYNFKSKIRLVQNNSSDAINETFILFELVKNKQKKISISTLRDLKKYYLPLNNEISKMMNQMVIEALTKTIKRGISEGSYQENTNPIVIASLVVFIFNSFIIKTLIKPENLSLSLDNLLDYHFNSICSQQGKIQWENLKNRINT